MKLRQVQGDVLVTKVHSSFNGRILLARIAGTDEWVALNHRSEDPTHLRNSSERATWALTQGLKVKDVENFVRREKRREAGEVLEEQLRDAKRTLEHFGFEVTGGKINLERTNAQD